MINTSTLIVNIALPQMSDQLGASTRDLLWIVDAFNLSFAALVLAAGSLSDRFGRRPALIFGLTLFAVASFVGSQAETPEVAIAFRVLAGIGAAVIYPVTLSVIVNVFDGRKQRSTAIAIWGGVGGLAIGAGPVFGGLLVDHFWWGSILVFTGAIAAVTLLATLRYVPDSRDPATPPLDYPGLAMSTFGLAVLVYTIIEAPERGRAGVESLFGFALAAVTLAAFVAYERRCEQPMLDIGLFRHARFTASSGAVTIAFFAMFGFTFIIVQYFQLIYGYGPLETGLRVLPVAGCTAPSALLGVKLALKVGNKIMVAAGLVSFTIAFAWISTLGVDTSYSVMVIQMAFLGIGFGLSTVPATEAIMGVVPMDRAGMGSAVNDATRELGGTLGVAVIGSVALSLYRDAFTDQNLNSAALDQVQSSPGAALSYAQGLDAAGAQKITSITQSGFLDGLQAGCLVAAGVTLVGALLVLRYLPAHPETAPAT